MKRVIFIFLAGLFFSCEQDEMPLPSPSKTSLFTKGSGQIRYTQYPPLSDRPVTIWYYNPIENPEDLPIMMVFHGAGRNANDYRDNWIDLADQYKLLIIAPEFSKTYFPNSNHYNLGNMFDENNNGASVSEEEWSYSIIEPIFDFVVASIGGKQTSYDVFGHSAGSQFVHRFLTYKENIRADRLVAANAGWYTMPDETVDFPYGLKNSSAGIEDIARIVQKNLIVLLGEADTSRTNSLRTTSEADAQGLNRLERGHSYFEAGKKASNDLKVPFNWKKEVVPGVGHSNGPMAEFAARMLYEN